MSVQSRQSLPAKSQLASAAAFELPIEPAGRDLRPLTQASPTIHGTDFGTFAPERFGSDFLVGDASILIRAASEEAERRPELQRRRMASYTGDDADRRRARELFRGKKYAAVVTVLESLRYPEYMDDFERKILEVARRNTASP